MPVARLKYRQKLAVVGKLEPKPLLARANSQIGSYHIRQMRDSVRRYIRNINIAAWKESLRKSLERERRDTFPVTTNKAHDKIEMVVSRDEDGDVNSQYLKRVKD